MRVEQEQKVTEDARRFAEQDATAQRYASQVLQVTFLFQILLLPFYSISIYLKRKHINSTLVLIRCGAFRL